MKYLEAFFAGKRPHTRRSYMRAIKDFKDFDKSRAGACGYIASLYKKGLSDGTIKRRYAALHSYYAYLVEIGAHKSNIFDAARRVISWRQNRQVRPTKIIKYESIEKTIEAIEPINKGIRDRAILALLFGCGLRRSELISLKVSDVQVSKEGILYLLIDDAKGGEARLQPIPEWAQPYLSDQVIFAKGLQCEENNFLFASQHGNSKNKILGDRTVARIFNKYFSSAPHAARATFATKLLEQGFDLLQVARALGHKHCDQVKTYDKRDKNLKNNCGIFVNY